MKKILLCQTGGTISSTKIQGVSDVDSTSINNAERFLKKTYEEFIFDVITPRKILSENVKISDILAIYKVISKNQENNNYYGIIITYGSDTLAYASAMLSFLLKDTKIPIVTTAANYPFEDKRSNAAANLTQTIDFFKKQKPGVFSIYDGKTYLASRLIEADYKDEFSTPFSEANLERDNIKLPKSFKNQVLAIRVYPFMSYNNYKLNKPIKAVIHTLYHSGTASTEGKSSSLINFIQRCKQRNIDVYIHNIKDFTADLYKTSDLLVKSGAIPLTNITFEAAYIKLIFAYNQSEISPAEFMRKNINNEILK